MRFFFCIQSVKRFLGLEIVVKSALVYTTLYVYLLVLYIQTLALLYLKHNLYNVVANFILSLPEQEEATWRPETQGQHSAGTSLRNFVAYIYYITQLCYYYNE